MVLRIHKTRWFLRSWVPAGLSSTIIVTILAAHVNCIRETSSWSRNCRKLFYLRVKRRVPKTEMSTRVRNGPKFVSFFQKCTLLSKKSLNVTEKAFRRWLGEGLKYHVFGICSRCLALTIRIKKVHLQGNWHTLMFTHPRPIQPFYQKVGQKVE